MSTSTKTESASRRLTTVQRHPVSLFRADLRRLMVVVDAASHLRRSHARNAGIRLDSVRLFGAVHGRDLDRRPTTWQAGRPDAARPPTEGPSRSSLVPGCACSCRLLAPLGVGLSVLFGGESPVIASTIVGVVVGRLVDLPRERSGRGARMARACPAASAIPPQRPARKPYRRSALGIVASAAVLDRSGAPSAEPLSSVRSQCRRCVSGVHLDVQRHQRKPAHRRALPRHRKPAPDSLPRTPWRSRRSAVPDLRRAERHHGGNDRGGHRARPCLPHTPQTGNHTIDSGREIHPATDRSARRAAGPLSWTAATSGPSSKSIPDRSTGLT
jgi:hypothetical protein